MTISWQNWAYEHGTLWAVATGQVIPVAPRIATSFAEVGRESAGLLAQAMGLPSPEPVLQRFRTDRRCFVALVEGNIAAFGWVSQGTESIGELERAFTMTTGQAYIWDCVTLPDYRRQRLFSALLTHIAATLRGEDLNLLWIGASLANHPSIRGFIDAGFRPIIKLWYARLFYLRVLWLVGYPAAPRWLVEDARLGMIARDDYAWGPLVLGYSEPAQSEAYAERER